MSLGLTTEFRSVLCSTVQGSFQKDLSLNEVLNVYPELDGKPLEMSEQRSDKSDYKIVRGSSPHSSQSLRGVEEGDCRSRKTSGVGGC